MRIFTSKQEYIDEYSKASNLNFNYIKDSLELFLIANFIIIGLFVLRLIVSKFKSWG